MDIEGEVQADPIAPWLLLIHQLPPKPAYFRVKIWRRLQAIGAVPLRNAVYALPNTADAREDFEWLLREIADGGGEAVLSEAKLLGGLSDEQVRGLFVAARDSDYHEIAESVRAAAASARSDPKGRAEARDQIARLRKRLSTVAAIDFFGADGRETVEGLLSSAEEELRQEDELLENADPKPSADGPLEGRTWVTRRGVHVDRIACAWLICRFIDPSAKIKFVSATGYAPLPGELRFDMFQAEFTHEGDQCSYEVLLSRCNLADPALNAIGDIVHDLDLKDEKFGREETAGTKALISGICMTTDDDEERVERGSAAFDGLYAYFRKKRG